MLCTIHALSLVPAPTSLASDKLWNEWHDLSIKDSRVEPESVIKLSRNLRKHWIGHLGEARAECRASQQETRELARNCLEQKDLSARILFASDAINLEKEPTRRFEEFLIAELLLDSSERYLDDFWDQWYADVARKCLDKAARLSPKLLDEDRNRVDALLAARHISVVAGGRLCRVRHTTHGDRISTRQKRHECATRFGYDVAVLQRRRPASLETPTARRSLPSSQRGSGCCSQCRFLRREPIWDRTARCSRTDDVRWLQVIADRPASLFRDHSWSSTKQADATFNPCRPEGTLIRHLAAASTGAIRVSGKDRKSVVFVLDASGSMLPDGNENKEDRWEHAKEILLGSLREMEANNRNDKAEPHQVELIVYGHRDPNDPGNIAFVKTEVPMSPLSVNLITAVGNKLKSIEPFDSTPLLTAAKQACDSLNDAKVPGTVIVITDGVPNDGATRDPVTKIFSTKGCRPVLELRKREINQILNRTRELHREVELQVIGLGLNAQQQPALTNEEAAVVELKAFIEEANGRDGKFYPARTFNDLKARSTSRRAHATFL